MVSDKRPPVVVKLKEVQDRIPRNKEGDPAFQVALPPPDETLEDWIEGNEEDWEWWREHAAPLMPLLEVFTPEQIVALVNRQLYQMEYQYEHHKKRQEEDREQKELIIRALKLVAPGVSLAKATEDQIRAAAAVAVKIKKGEIQ